MPQQKIRRSDGMKTNGYGKDDKNKRNHAVGQSIAATDGKQRGGQQQRVGNAHQQENCNPVKWIHKKTLGIKSLNIKENRADKFMYNFIKQ